ncbi:MAG: NlpC/P60 family protein, partial [Bacteroidota bacterium]
PRVAAGQVEKGEMVDFIEQAEPGDLAFFENNKGRISHVGLILRKPSENQPGFDIIHAYGKVRIDKIDHYGIFNADTRRYSHKLRVIKRVLPKAIAPVSDIADVIGQESTQVELF